MKFSILFCFLIMNYSCNAQKEVTIKISEQSLNIDDFEQILQDVLNLNYLDYLFKDKKSEIAIVKNKLIKQHYRYLNLIKFDKKIKFRTHREILNEENSEFIDIVDGSIFIKDDILHLTLGLRYYNTGIQAKYKKYKNGDWVMLNEIQVNNIKYSPIYRFNKDKEQCLAEQIRQLKTGKIPINKCLKYKFIE